MAWCDMELERQLMDAGNKLLEPPDSVDEVLHLLDQVESCLARVEQSPTKSMQSAISPSQKALVANQLFRHSEVDVKVAVASCISEITRITAPDAPYDDDQMKEVFELIVSSFEKLSDKFSRSYAKRTSILEIVAKVKSCVVMLDLECDGPIIEMFQHFLEAIRGDHPESVFSSMETIMNIVLEESEMISPELLSPILDSVRKNEEVLPIARKLGEKVLHSCAAKVKPNLLEAVKSSGISLDDYSEVVASICQEESVAVEQNDLSNELMTDEEESKSVKAPFDEAARVNKEIVTEAASMEQVDPADNRSPKSIVNNGTAQTGDISKKESGASSESEAKLLKQSAQKVDASINNGDGSSLKQSHDKKRWEKATPGKDATRSSTEDDMLFAKPTKDRLHFEATSKSNFKRKRTPRKGKTSDTKDLGENLVGSKVKVWWPEDRMFYEGSIESFDHVKKKHKVLACIQRVSQILRDAVNSVQQSIFNWNQTAITCIEILDDAGVAGLSTAAAPLSPRPPQQSTTPSSAPALSLERETMASCDMELERQLMDAGNKLLEPPDSVDEVLHLLDQVESYLARVEQSPTKSMQSAISPSQKALVANKLFRHSEVDVKVAVASCISEITRITAPDAPYDDDQMKEVFELIVSSFERLSDKSSRSYARRTSILEIVAEVRSCVVMLNLECDALIIEMFQHFLEAIRDDHPESVFSSMETIMNIVLEESEKISPELLSPILDSVKKNEVVLPIARKLGEKVLHSCVAKVKPNLLEAVKSSGISLDDYSEVVASICQEESVAVEQNDLSNEHTTDEEESKSVKAPFDEAAWVNKEIVTEAASMEQVDPADNRSPKSIVNNGTAQTGDISKKESGASSESEAKLLKQSAQKVDAGVNNGDGSSLKQSHDKKRWEKATPGKDATRSSTKDDMEMVSSPKSFAKPTKDRLHFEATSKSNFKRKRTPRKGKASDTKDLGENLVGSKASDNKDLGENLVGSKVKVWWPEDRMFYEGSIESFDHVKKKHKVLTCIQRVSQILRDAVNSVQQSIFNWNQTAITCIGILDDADVAGPSTAAARLSPRLLQQSTAPALAPASAPAPAPAPEANSPSEPSY